MNLNASLCKWILSLRCHHKCFLSLTSSDFCLVVRFWTLKQINYWRIHRWCWKREGANHLQKQGQWGVTNGNKQQPKNKKEKSRESKLKKANKWITFINLSQMQTFTNKDAKCYDRCKLWYCIKYAAL